MDATKLTVSPDTLRFQPMARGKKTKLRRQNIIDLIQSKPSGTPIGLQEFAVVTQTTPSNAWRLVRTMIKRGAISQDRISERRAAYRVNGPVTTKKLDMPIPPPTTATPPTQCSISDYA